MAKAKRPGQAAGSIFKRSLRGRVTWVGMVTVGRNEKGGRVRRTVYGKTQGAVQEKIDNLREELRLGVKVEAGRTTFKDFATVWMDDIKGDSLKESTRATYSDLLKLHILPHLGSFTLEKIQPADLRTWQAALRRKRVGASTCRSAFVLVRGILKAAVKDDAIRYNAAERVDVPTAGAARRSALEPAQVLTLLAEARKRDAEALVVLGVVCGLRIGEVLGLEWRHVDLATATLHVEQQLVEARRSGARSLGTVKGRQGEDKKRDVALPGIVIAALQRHRAVVHQRWVAEAEEALKAGVPAPANPTGPDELVFQAARGGPLRRSNWHRRTWKPIREAAGLPTHRFHDNRHCAASALIASGVDIATTAATLGHSSPHVTLRLYSHAVESRKREAAAKMDALYSSS